MVWHGAVYDLLLLWKPGNMEHTSVNRALIPTADLQHTWYRTWCSGADHALSSLGSSLPTYNHLDVSGEQNLQLIPLGASGMI